jgi:hypothetical protein
MSHFNATLFATLLLCYILIATTNAMLLLLFTALLSTSSLLSNVLYIVLTFGHNTGGIGKSKNIALDFYFFCEF